MAGRLLKFLALLVLVMSYPFLAAAIDCAPTVTLELVPDSPHAMAYVDGEGVATDPSGVAKVEYRYSRDGGAWTAWASAVPEDGAFDEAEEWYDFVSHVDGYIYDLPSGSYTFQVRATDATGCTTLDIFYAQDSITIDTDRPVITIAPVTPNPTADATPTITGTASDPNGVCLVGYRMRKDGGVWSSWDWIVDQHCDSYSSGPASVPFSLGLGPLGDGDYELEFFARDSGWCCGRASDGGYVSVTFTVAAAPPHVAAIVVDTNPICKPDLTQQVEASFSETMDVLFPPVIGFSAGSFASLGDGAWSAGNTVWTETFLFADNDEFVPDVLISVSGARDKLGNVQQDYTGEPEFDIDTRSPGSDDVPASPIAPAGESSPSWSITPTGEGSPCAFLDRDLPLLEGEEQPMLGLRPLCAVYDVGELVTGSCAISDEEGNLVRSSYIHIFVYGVDPAGEPELVTLIDHWVTHLDRVIGLYPIVWDTTDRPVGCYDIALSYPHGVTHTCRIRLGVAGE